MPSNAVVTCYVGRSDLSLTASLFPDGSDTATETGITVTQATNRKGVYTFNSGTAVGLHLIQLLEGSTVRWIGWAVMAITGNITACDYRKESFAIPNATAGDSSGLALQSGVQAVDDYLHNEITTALTTIDTVADAIKLKTDDLPDDPADASVIAASFTSIANTLTTIAGYIDTEVQLILTRIGTPSTSIAADLHNLPVEVRDVDNTSASDGSLGDDINDLGTSVASIITLINTLTTYVDTEIAAIKLKTDQLVFADNRVNANATATVDEQAIAEAVVSELENNGVSVTITSQPLTDGGEIEIVIGDDYYAADDRALTCRIEQTGVGLLTTDDWSIVLNSVHETPTVVEGTATRVDDDTLDLSFDVSSAVTSVLRAGEGDWSVVQTTQSTEHRISPVRGIMQVLQDLTELRRKRECVE